MSLLITLIILGVVFYFVEQIPMAAPFQVAVRVVAAIMALMAILKYFNVNLL